jgi:hypothetical protein
MWNFTEGAAILIGLIVMLAGGVAITAGLCLLALDPLLMLFKVKREILDYFRCRRKFRQWKREVGH